MKKKIFYFVYVLFLINTTACKKASVSSIKEEFNLETAKEWWYGTFRKSNFYNAVDWSSPLAPPIGSSTKKYPSWDKASYYKLGSMQIIELPLFHVTNKVLLPGMQDLNHTTQGERIAKSVINKLLIIKRPDGILSVRIATLIPSVSYAQQFNYDISHLQLKKLPNDFSGFLNIGGWNLRQINLAKIENGKMVKTRKLISEKELSKYNNLQARNTFTVCPPPIYVPDWEFVCAIVPTGDAVADAQHCQEIGHWVDAGGAYEIPDCEEVGEGETDPLMDCITAGGSQEECYCQLFGIGCSGPGETNPNLCYLDCGEVASLMASMSTTELNNITIQNPNATESSPDEFGIVKKAKNPKWEFLKVNWGLTFSTTYSAFFNGTVYKQPNNSTTWKWESLSYQNAYKTAGSTPPCISAELNASVGNTTISENKLTASATINYSVSASYSCFFDSDAGTLSGTVTQSFGANQ